MSTTFILAILLLFVAVVLASQGAWEWWNSRHGAVARRLESRIEAVATGGVGRKEAMSILKARKLDGSTFGQRMLLLVPGIRSFEAWVQQSGISWTASRVIAMCALMPVVVIVAGIFIRVPLAMLASAAASSTLMPLMYVRYRRTKRMRRFQKQLPDACDMLARALRSGHAFSGAIDLVGTEFADPMGAEFRTTFDEINYGVSLNEALTALAQRVPVGDLRYLVIAVLIQRETGGNLAELLDGIASLVRARFKLFDKVRVLAAEGVLSARVLGLLPVVTGGAISLVNPGFLEVLWRDPAGVMMLEAGSALLVAGMIWGRRIVRIRV
ncbi:type II secretion system F family protein [Paraburkholderia silvatlantica]|uniref:Tight adherence protein B n=1 Tax=Paraburkholderia silvatlantica TaxID=321895 RepID=A0ABR6FXP2_9BURK|nr:type II secretion system F family protein [Paraburkholderia silvatlantica]MBB2932195.1 tight adherence protein B [Paraburkholderia silvatlantica]PVY23230.1 tight adherence protein B [Paraburkholderia silvatlantica]PXW29789.1 tight adherence protein B [Paraburkholderia silvatlantica]